MLTSQLGIRLLLLTGKTVPLPASSDVTAALTRVEVNNESERRDGFQMNFALGKDKTLDYSLLKSGALDLFNRVVIGAVFGALPEVLIDGIITHHQITPGAQPGMSTLTVTGESVSVMLDLEEKNAEFPNQPDFVIALRLIAGYAQYGLIPQTTPTADVPIFLQRIPRQSETDLRFLERMAQRNGYVFYVEPLTFGVNTAYWGPENRLGLPQSALTMGLGAATNIKSIHFSNDGMAPVSPGGTLVEPITKTALPIPSLPSLRIPPLVSSPTPARRKTLLRETANQNPAQAATTAVAATSRAPEAVTGQGELDAVRYGGALRARKLVGVRGVGLSYDGFYYVRRVKHTITILPQGDYKQEFTISREGTGPLLPLVRPDP